MTLPLMLFQIYTVVNSLVLLVALVLFIKRKGVRWIRQEMAQEQQKNQTLEQAKQTLGQSLEELDQQIMAQQTEFQELQRVVLLWRDACSQQRQLDEQVRHVRDSAMGERARVRARCLYQEELMKRALPQASRHAYEKLTRCFSQEIEQRRFIGAILERLTQEGS